MLGGIIPLLLSVPSFRCFSPRSEQRRFGLVSLWPFVLWMAAGKVASSEWKKLFFRLRGDTEWRTEPWWKMRCAT